MTPRLTIPALEITMPLALDTELEARMAWNRCYSVRAAGSRHPALVTVTTSVPASPYCIFEPEDVRELYEHTRRWSTYGDGRGERSGPAEILSTNQPALLQHLLVASQSKFGLAGLPGWERVIAGGPDAPLADREGEGGLRADECLGSRRPS